MPFAPLDNWKSTYKLMVLPTIAPDGPIKLAAWLSFHITGRPALDPASVISPSFGCVWQASVFVPLMLGIPPSLDRTLYAVKLGQAWAAATQASVLVVPPGASVGAPTPPTTFSAPPVALFNPATVAAGMASIIAKISLAPPTPDASQSVIIEALYSATVQLKVTLTGLNSVVPPAGPQPLIVPMAGLV